MLLCSGMICCSVSTFMDMVRGSLCLISVEEDTSHYTPLIRSRSLSITKNGLPGATVSESVDHKHQGSGPGFNAEHTVSVTGYDLDVSEKANFSHTLAWPIQQIVYLGKLRTLWHH